MAETGYIHPIDIHIGARICLRRSMKEVSEEELGTAINVDAQQVQKYELAEERLSFGKLQEIAQALKTPMGWFFAEYEDIDWQAIMLTQYLLPGKDGTLYRDVMMAIKYFCRIQDQERRRLALDMLRQATEPP